MSVLTFQRKQRALGDIHFCFLSQLAYNSEILSKFVSQEVLSLLEDGWRLTCNYNAPCENDFK